MEGFSENIMRNVLRSFVNADDRYSGKTYDVAFHQISKECSVNPDRLKYYFILLMNNKIKDSLSDKEDGVNQLREELDDCVDTLTNLVKRIEFIEKKIYGNDTNIVYTDIGPVITNGMIKDNEDDYE